MGQPSLEAARQGVVSKHPACLYDTLWTEADIIDYRIWPIWEEVRRYIPEQSRRLEIGCGIAPKIPSAGSYFVDLSPPALKKLQGQGGHGARADGGILPFLDKSFDAVISSAVLEHIRDDRAALAEVARVLRPGGYLMLTIPTGPQYWTRFDEVVGHYRRYTAEQIEELLAATGFTLRSFSAFRIFHGHRAANMMAYFITRYPRLSWWFTKKFLLPRRLQTQLEWAGDGFHHRLKDATDVNIIAQKK